MNVKIQSKSSDQQPCLSTFGFEVETGHQTSKANQIQASRQEAIGHPQSELLLCLEVETCSITTFSSTKSFKQLDIPRFKLVSQGRDSFQVRISSMSRGRDL